MPTTATSTLAGSRLAAGSRNVATVDRAPVEALNPKIGTSLDDGSFLFQAYDHGTDTPRREPEVDLQGFGLVRATSQAFAAFLEFDSSSETAADAARKSGTGGYGGLLARAIRTYEANAIIISGTAVPRGNSLSVNL